MNKTEQVEAIVIGSGFGGAIAAASLTEAGVNVALIERGPWWDTVPTRSMGIEDRVLFPRGFQLFTRSVRSAYHPLFPWGRTLFNRKGLLELYFSKGMEIICSSGVGGGSHIYSAVHRRPARTDYWDGHCDDLGEETMSRHYDSFITRVGSAKAGAHNRPPHTAAEIYENDPNFAPAVSKSEVRTGFLFPENPETPRLVKNEFGVERWETNYRNGDDGFLGSPSGSKSTLDIVYIAPALKNGLIVHDMCEVSFIQNISKRGNRFRVHFYDHKIRKKRQINSEFVFVGAGTMNTLRLLLESRDKYQGLEGMPALGRRFSGNGDIRGYWDLNDLDRDFSQGMASKGGIVLRGDWEPKHAIGRNNMPSVDSYPFPKFVRKRIKHGLVVSGMGEDAMDGVVSLRNGRFQIEFEPKNSPIYAQLYETMMEMERRSGRKLYAKRRPSTCHPMGGACVGRPERGGVIGSDGEVYDVPGLFVVDAAAFPAPTASPPTMAIGAWAENVASRFVGTR